MKKSLKIFLVVCTTLVVFCLTAVFAAMVAIDPNEYKGEIAQLVRDKIGRELSFEGDIGLSFFPYVGFNVGPVALHNAPGFSEPEMVRINKAEVSVRLAPLFSGKVSVGKVVLDGLSVYLVKNEQGATNWEDLAGGEVATAQSSSVDVSADSGHGEGGMDLDAISVQGVEITNANLFFSDLQKQSKTSIGNLNLTLGAIHGTDRFPFALGFDLSLDQSKMTVHPSFSGDIQLDPTSGTVALDNLSASMLGLQVAGHIHASVQDGASIFTGNLELAETSLRDLLAKLDTSLPEMADPAALERFSAAMNFAGTDDSIRFETLLVRLDDTTLSAEGAVSDFAAPQITLAAQVDNIDIDRYLPPRTESNAEDRPEELSSASSSAQSAQEPDLSALRDFALDARLEVGGCKVMNLEAANILIDVSARDGILSVSPFSLDLYDGRLEGQAELDASGGVAAWAGRGSLQALNAGDLLYDLLNKDLLNGVAALEYAISGTGLTPEGVKQTVSGTAALSVSDGSVIGVDVAKMIRDGWNEIMGADSDGEATGDFEFSSLTASAVLKNGHIVNNDLAFQSALVEASGAGWADLPENTTDYRAMVTVVGSLDGLEGEILEAVRDVPLPLQVKGALDQPSIGLDMQAMGEVLVTAGIGAGLDILADGLLGDSDEDAFTDEDAAYESDDSYDDDEDDLLEDLF